MITNFLNWKDLGNHIGQSVTENFFWPLRGKQEHGWKKEFANISERLNRMGTANRR